MSRHVVLWMQRPEHTGTEPALMPDPRGSKGPEQVVQRGTLAG